MNRSAVRSLAVWARGFLREQVGARFARLGVSSAGVVEPRFVGGGMSVGGVAFDAGTAGLYRQFRVELDARVRAGASVGDAVEGLVDEVAYTWFNRLCALRYMEVNGYIGRVLSSSEGLVDPDVLRHASSVVGELGVSLEELDGWRRQGEDVAYRNLLVAQCRSLAGSLPFLFGEGKAYAALFLPEHLLTQNSIVRRLVGEIPEDDWREIEVLGWLYQFYISERKAEVMAGRGAYEARDIPAATQLFTPHWIVRYMVENSVGRLWLEAHPESGLREKMPYLLEAEGGDAGEREVGFPGLRPEDLTVMDPACGSGHILVYAFDLLFEIYREQGYAEPRIARLILENNLFGLDLDERAAQLASFALLMKARERDRRVLREPPALGLAHTVPTRGWTVPDAPELCREDWQPLLDAFVDADSLGSLIDPPEVDLDALGEQLVAFEGSGRQEVGWEAPRLQSLLEQARLLSNRYGAVVANPPYMGSASFNKTLKEYVNARFPRSKADLFAAFVERALELAGMTGAVGMLTQMSWMSLASYASLRKYIFGQFTVSSMAHMGFGAFGADFGTTAFTILKGSTPAGGRSVYVSLREARDVDEKERRFLSGLGRYEHEGRPAFGQIPGSPIAYWASDRLLSAFGAFRSIRDVAETRKGLATGNNDRFVRHWFEVRADGIGLGFGTRVQAQASRKSWFPLNDGGPFRRWSGNHGAVVDWSDDGYELRSEKTSDGSRIRATNLNLDHIFRPAVTWSQVTSAAFSARVTPQGFLFSNAGTSLFASPAILMSILSLLNSVVSTEFLKAVSPTLNFNPGEIGKIPFATILDETGIQMAEEAVHVSTADWDAFETSWDFERHPMVRDGVACLSDAFATWEGEAGHRFAELRRLEEENNRFWIEAYGLDGELSPEVPEDEVSVRRADLGRDVRGLISYAVGCMMGRYSLDEPGLVHAGQAFDASRHRRFAADPDAIVPVTDVPYFEDDVVGRFVEFLRVVYGEEHLEENLEFVAEALVRKQGEGAVERLRRYFVSEFVSDHIRMYSKRPIYWLFTSGKQRAFGALVYLHRYDRDALGRMRTEYVLPLQVKLDAEIAQATRVRDEAASGAAVRQAERRLKELGDQRLELRQFEERLRHEADRRIAVDLDDGVAYNYTLFDGLVYEGSDLKMSDMVKRSQWKRDLIAETEA